VVPLAQLRRQRHRADPRPALFLTTRAADAEGRRWIRLEPANSNHLAARYTLSVASVIEPLERSSNAAQFDAALAVCRDGHFLRLDGVDPGYSSDACLVQFNSLTTLLRLLLVPQQLCPSIRKATAESFIVNLSHDHAILVACREARSIVRDNALAPY
jgi:hypothetical protein